MTTISQSILQVHVPDECFHDAARALLQVLARAGGLTTNYSSYPHEDTMTVAGRGGNGSGALRMTRGREAERTWEIGGEQTTKEMII